MNVFKILSQLLLYFQLSLTCFCQNNDSVTLQDQKGVAVSDKNFQLGRNVMTIFKLHTKVRVQEMELNVYKNLKKIDSTRYGNDSLLVCFIDDKGRLLKKIKSKYGKDRTAMTDIRDVSYYRDSITTYFNKNGCPDYEERWKETYQYGPGNKLATDTVFYWTKAAYARYEYDDQNRLTKFVKVYSHDAVSEISISYDLEGKAIHNSKRIDEWNFWGDPTSGLKN